MNFEVLNDFEFHSAVPEEIIEKYKDTVPPELLEIWKEYGFGSFMNGYLKIINPDDYRQILDDSYFASDESVPIFVTGFADIVTWEENEFVVVVKYRKKGVEVLFADFNGFMEDISITSEFWAKEFDNIQYTEAIGKLGGIKYDECLYYTPHLFLGGAEKAENLKKGALNVSLDIMIQFIGRIE